MRSFNHKHSTKSQRNSSGKIRRKIRENVSHTIPGVKHVSDEVVNEGELRLGYAAGVPVKHWHHHGQPLPLLLVRLQVEPTDP